MVHSANNWLVGLIGVAFVLGSLVSYLAWSLLHRYFRDQKTKLGWKIEQELVQTLPFIAILVGVLERIFFAVLIAFEVNGVGAAMIAWIGIKLAIGWGNLKDGKTASRTMAFVGLLSSLISMFFAVLGGLICLGKIGNPLS